MHRATVLIGTELFNFIINVSYRFLSRTKLHTFFQKENYLIVQLNKAFMFHLKIKIRSTNKDIIRKQLVISKDSLESVNINEDTSEKK